jgi:GMP synthase (glutamine-hydrolysing)
VVLSIQVWTTGEPVPGALEARGRFFSMFERALRDADSGSGPLLAEVELSNVEAVTLAELPKAGSADGVIITGSPAFVRQEQEWMLRLQAGVRELVDAKVPTLGVCFGHQILGEALGGRVEKNPRGREIGTAQLALEADDELLLPSEHDSRRQWVQMSHLDSLVELPRGAKVLASTQLEPFAGVRFSKWAWGVQFHPEMDAEIVRHYIEARKDAMALEGLNVPSFLASVRESSYGARLLAKFLSLAAAKKG